MLYYIVTCGLSGSTLLFHIISLTAQFLDKVIEHKMYVLILCNLSLKHSSFKEFGEILSHMCIGIYVKYLLYLIDFN
jgi:hypothetical protein